MKIINGISFILFSVFFCCAEEKPLYITTSADTEFFPVLLNLIGSIHKHNFHNLGEIAVFNLGFTEQQIKELNTIQKVAVYDVELTHPDLLKKVKVNNSGKLVRGWYAWKPVVIKQALDLFPYVIYLDAGLMVINTLDELFEEIWRKGYLLTGCGASIKWMSPRHVIETFHLYGGRAWLLDDSIEGVAGGFMGVSQEYKKSFIEPIYQMSFDLNHFVDDGTTPNGFGTARHDQVLFSIQALLLGLTFGAWKDQARINVNGVLKPCLYKDIIIRAHHLMDVCHLDENRIRAHIKYK